ncbi:reverse transcriptase domain-containing protein [Tanacetum coccineum]
MNHNLNQGPPPVGPIPQNQALDLQTIEELCQPTMNGRGEPIAPVNIQATDFGLKNHMIQQVQNICQFHELPGDDANKHLDKFLTITQSMKQNGVTDDALCLYLFPYSLTHHATAWFDRLLKNYNHNFKEMVSKFLSKYFPPSMVKKLRNDITNQMTKMEKAFNERPQGVLPSNTVSNPREEVKVITTQRGRTLAGLSVPSPTPYSSSKEAKMLKDLLSNKEKLLELDNTHLNENCSVVLLKKLPEKLGDPGKFPILCDFSELEECMALADLGASINLMPLSVWKELMLLELLPTRMTLELANRSVSYLDGISEDVFVQVDNFTFPADFVTTAFLALDSIPPDIDNVIYDSEGDILFLETLLKDEPIVASSSPSLTPFGDTDFLLEKTDAFLALDSIPPNIDNQIYDLEGDILFLESLLKDEPSEAKKSEINPAIREPSNTFLMGDEEIKFNHLKDIVPIPRVSETPLDSLDSYLDTFEKSNESEMETIMDEPTVVQEDDTTREKTYAELSATEKLQADCDCKATNIVLQGLPPDVYAIVNHHKVAKEIWDRVKLLMQGTKLSLQEKECKLYDEFDKFSFVKDPLAFVANYHQSPAQLNNYHSQYTPTQFPQQTYMIPQVYYLQSYSPMYLPPHPSQPQINHSSIPPSHEYQSHMNHQTSSVLQIAYHSPQALTQPMNEFPQVDSGLAIPVNWATIQDGRVTVQQVQGRQGQSYSGTGYKGNATSSVGNNISGHARVVKCYNCQGEGHMARQCTQSKRLRNAAWFKEKAMLAEAQEAGLIRVL